MKYTPGPWEIGHYDKCTVWTVNNYETQRLQIANCKYLDQEFGEDIREETRKQAEANARLIAAMPELLEACEDTANKCTWCLGIGKDYEGNSCQNCEKARTAITKAKGIKEK